MGVDVRVALENARALQAQGLVEEARRAFAAVMNDSEHRVAGFIGFIQCDALLSGREKALGRGESLVELWALTGDDVERARRYLETLRSSTGASDRTSKVDSRNEDEVVELDFQDIDVLDDTACTPVQRAGIRPRSLRSEVNQSLTGTRAPPPRRECSSPIGEEASEGAQIVPLFGQRPDQRPTAEKANATPSSPTDARVPESEEPVARPESSVEPDETSTIVEPQSVEPSARSARPLRVTTRGGRLSLRSGLARGSGERSSDDDKDFAF